MYVAVKARAVVPNLFIKLVRAGGESLEQPAAYITDAYLSTHHSRHSDNKLVNSARVETVK